MVFPVVKTEAVQASASIHVPMYIRCPHAHPALAPGRHWAELGHCHPRLCPSDLWPRAPRDPFNLPNTKKLKYFNILVFFLGARVYALGPGVALCYIYIYIYNLYIYIIFFLVGFVFNSVVLNGGKPQSQRVSYLGARK